MIIVVQGSKTFEDYTTFMRAMGVALSNLGEGEPIEIWSVGGHKINNFAAEFSNRSERFLRSRGHKIRYRLVNLPAVELSIGDVGYLAYFLTKGEPTSKLVALAQLNDLEIGIYRV